MKDPKMEKELQRIAQRAMGRPIMINPPLSPQPTGTNKKLFLQIRICGEDSMGVRKLKKEYQIELPSNVDSLGEPWLVQERIHPDGHLPAVIIPVSSPQPNSGSIEAVTPTQHESKVI